MLATAPFSNSIRAFAASTLSEITGMPTARISETFDIFADQPLNRVEIVNHHVQNDIDIERAIRKRRNAVNLEIKRFRHKRAQRDHRRIVSFQMSDHQFRAGFFCRFDHQIGFFERSAQSVFRPELERLFPEKRRRFPQCVSVGVTIETASTLSSKSRQSVKYSQSFSSAICCAFSSFESHTPTNSIRFRGQFQHNFGRDADRDCRHRWQRFLDLGFWILDFDCFHNLKAVWFFSNTYHFPSRWSEITKDQRPKTEDQKPIRWLFFAVHHRRRLFFRARRFPLLGPDEPRYAQVAREMFERGDWITPTLGGFDWFEKPALFYWLQITSYKIFGVSEFAARFGSAIFGFGTIFSLWILGRNSATETQIEHENQKIKIQRPISPTGSLLIAASSIGLLAFSRGASFDIILTFPITASLVSFFIFDQTADKNRASLFTFHFSPFTFSSASHCSPKVWSALFFRLPLSRFIIFFHANFRIKLLSSV